MAKELLMEVQARKASVRDRRLPETERGILQLSVRGLTGRLDFFVQRYMPGNRILLMVKVW